MNVTVMGTNVDKLPQGKVTKEYLATLALATVLDVALSVASVMVVAVLLAVVSSY